MKLLMFHASMCKASAHGSNYIGMSVVYKQGPGVAKLVQCPTTDWTAEIRSPAEANYFSSSVCVQSNSEAYTMGTGGPFLGGIMWLGRDSDLSPHLLPRS
jgi:hypothetical protein